MTLAVKGLMMMMMMNSLKKKKTDVYFFFFSLSLSQNADNSGIDIY